ncbi:hypothetical protein [Lactiplantibacillus songbeiensis]|uniref:hypothetical protein n=1 Tax=Lactiplantibacillus songbeiensis TaxID=2559920 RepID=UPI0014857FBE|nr:hypothetical protein [Lactiplantibacillus songbeiensis]
MIAWNVVAAVVSQSTVSQAGLYLSRQITTKINNTAEPILGRPALIIGYHVNTL